MAITTTTITKSAGWSRSDVITQLEDAFNWLDWHGSPHTGVANTITSYTGGGTVGVSADIYQDVRPVLSTGIGTGASFYVQRSGGSIYRIHVNRPGYGFTAGEIVTLSSEDIGGSSSGATDLELTLGISTETYGDSTFYDSDTSGSYPWGVLRHVIQEDKKYGDTYRAFQMDSSTTMGIYAGSGFNPNDTQWTSGNGNYYPNRFAGESNLDLSAYTIASSSYFDSSSLRMTSYDQRVLTLANSSSYDLDLNIYRSGIDPNFVVFSYKQPTLSSTKLRDNTFATFILHNFTSNLWDYDEVFLGGVTTIEPSGSDTNPYLQFLTECAGLQQVDSSWISKRTAESGYLGQESSSVTANKYARYYATIADTYGSTDEPGIYYRDSNRYGSYNAVIKGIPLCLNLIPNPYFIPDDFVLIQFEYSSPSANIQQGDTVTISGSEVYTVITGSYRQDSTTRGILFCARTT